jgi:glutathione S-transferase
MFKLYARENTGSAAVEALLAVCSAPHTLITVERTASGGVPDWLLAKNPHGKIPTLELPDGTIMSESAAIMLHIADCFPAAKLAPDIGTSARATYMRWMIYFAAGPYDSDLRLYYPERYSIDPAHADGIKAKAIIDLNSEFDIFAKALGEGPFILGHQMTAADIYIAMILAWSEDMPALFKRQPKLQNLYTAVTANPAIRKVWDRNQMP